MLNLVRNVCESSRIEAVALRTRSRHKLVEESDRLLTWVVVVLVLNHARLHVSQAKQRRYKTCHLSL